MRVLAVLACVVACACGHHAHETGSDAVLLPDLTPVAADMNGSVMVMDESFDSDACELADQCIGAAGSRRLMLFTTAFENVGTADLDLGPVPPDGVSSGIYVWSPCHMHQHVIGFTSYTLQNENGVITTGRKQPFCIEDDEQIDPVEPAHYTCNTQGISVGWADVYDRSLPCQWLDVTDVTPGTYTLIVTVDPDGIYPDSNPNDKVWTTTVTL
jgi:hypothetical protein